MLRTISLSIVFLMLLAPGALGQPPAAEASQAKAPKRIEPLKATPKPMAEKKPTTKETAPKKEVKPEAKKEKPKKAPKKETKPAPIKEAPKKSEGKKDSKPKAPVKPEVEPKKEAKPKETPKATPKEDATTLLKEFVILPSVGKYSRLAFHQDPLELQLVEGTFKTPKEGDTLGTTDKQTRMWKSAKVNKDGMLINSTLAGGYAFAAVESKKERVVILSAKGHSNVFINGNPRTGDPYETGEVHLPILLKKGTNEFLFHIGAGRLHAEFSAPKSPVMLDMSDTTLPDLIQGKSETVWGAVVLINASNKPLEATSLLCTHVGGKSISTPVSKMPPLSVRKIPFQMDGKNLAKRGLAKYEIDLVQQGNSKEKAKRTVLAKQTLSLKVIAKHKQHARTFVSKIDGSVQKYVVRPAKKKKQTDDKDKTESPSLIVALHSAGYTPEQYASLYKAKNWAHILVPMNRRAYGFDWEDWGRMDALEAMVDFKKRYSYDKKRVYITGHAMGGHGAWHIASLYPDRFAAVAPISAWRDFLSTAKKKANPKPGPLEAILRRSALTGSVALYATNLNNLGVYVLHGQEDKSVSVNESRVMRVILGKFHTNFAYLEERGKGYWWDGCVNTKPMNQFLKRQTAMDNKDIKAVNFVTSDPSIASKMHWVTLESQTKPMLPSRVGIKCDPKKRTYTGKTTNVERFSIDVSGLKPRGQIKIELDGQKLPNARWPGLSRKIRLLRVRGKWTLVKTDASKKLKGPHRGGSFKSIFNNRAVLVYGTNGSKAKNRWALAKAKYDAETFWRRGNGSFEVIADEDFNPKKFKDRNVVLYGNASTNAAWAGLLSTSETQVRSGVVTAGTRREYGNDLACLFIQPRQDSNIASVGVVSGSGIKGMRLTNRMRYFVSGVALPDLAIFGPEVLEEGAKAATALGFFGNDWKLKSGSFAWRDITL